MKKILLTIKLIFFVIILSWINFVSTSYAASDDGWTLIPEGSTSAAEAVSEAKPGEVWTEYNKYASSKAWDAFASWVFSWNSVFDFFQKLAKTLSWIGLVIWAAMIVYAGYKYATWVFTWDAAKWWQDAVKWAIYWVLIVIFSYAIMKLLISTFL